MKVRSYNYYEIRWNVGRDDEEFVWRSDDFILVLNRFNSMLKEVEQLRSERSLYIVEVQVLKKADPKE